MTREQYLQFRLDCVEGEGGRSLCFITRRRPGLRAVTCSKLASSTSRLVDQAGLPTLADKLPVEPLWIPEIKWNGYRIDRRGSERAVL